VVTCVIAEDHELVGSGIGRALETHGVEVVDRVGSLSAAAATDHCDVLILDLGLPDTCRLRAVGCLAEARPGVPILVLTATPDPIVAQLSVSSGARGFFGKHVSPAELIRAIEALADGGIACDTEIARQWADHRAIDGSTDARLDKLVVGPVVDPTDVAAILHAVGTQSTCLTEAQMQIMILVACGDANKTIASKLGVRTKTIERHLAHVRERLGLPYGEARPLSVVAERLHAGCMLPVDQHVVERSGRQSAGQS
jgi:two-component system, NarL family, nitrate/nitrite response regulator NarL